MAVPNNTVNGDPTARSESAAAPTIVADALSGAPIVLPSSRFATDAEFLQQGDDLLLIGPDGATVIVRDYFLTDTPPNLLTPDGGRLRIARSRSTSPPY